MTVLPVLALLLTPALRAPRRLAPRRRAEEVPALPERASDTRRTSDERVLEVDGEPIRFNELGPIVMNEDGSMGVLSQWCVRVRAGARDIARVRYGLKLRTLSGQE